MSRHKVPTHLNQPDGIGKFSFRQIALVGGALLYLLPPVYAVLPKDGPAVGDFLRLAYPGLAWLFQPGSLPVVPILGVLIVLGPFVAAALPLDPPFEHGLFVCLRWVLFTRGYRQPAKVAEDLGELVVNGDRVESDFGFHAVWELPTVNLRLADPSEVDQVEDRWGEFLTGLTTPVQTLVRATRVDPEVIVSRIEHYNPSRNGSAATVKAGGRTPAQNARNVAIALRSLVKDHHLIERRHFLIAWAGDEQSFVETVDEVADGIGDLGLQSSLVRRLENDELKLTVQSTWSSKLPEKKRLGPVERTFNAVGAWFADGEWHISLAYGKWPRVIADNALAPLVDGVYEVDVIVQTEPVEADTILNGLERKSEALKITDQVGGRWRKRILAIEDLDEFIIKLESGEESAFDVGVFLHLHGPTRKEVVANARRVVKRVRRTGARANWMPWEQASAMTTVAPLGINGMERRTRRVDTSSVKNLYPWTASSMWMRDAIPWGETLDSKRPVGLNRWLQPIITNPHMVVYALTGGGKGFMIKIVESRELFAGLTQELFAFDQAQEDPVNGEYGKWAAYCGLEYRHVTSQSDFAAALADLDNTRWLGPGIVWNIAQLPLKDRPEFLATFKDKLWKRAAARPANRRWLVDELWSFVKLSEQMNCDPHWLAMCQAAIEDLVRTGRHMHVGADLMTQRAKDSLDVPVMQVIQDQCATQCYGVQNPSHIADIADRLHWTSAEVRQIRKFTAGEWIVSSGPWRVAMKVTHASDEEFEMAQTDTVTAQPVAA